MGASDDELIDLAGAILDGRPVDWKLADTDPNLDPDLLDQLRIVSELARVHRSQTALEPERDHPALAGLDTSTLPRWGHLLLLERVGGGSFGDVYRAWDTRLEREVALKLIDASNDPPGRLSAIEEGRLLARIHHPNVVAVHGAERIDDQIGIWTEFIRGRTLEQILMRDRPFTVAEAASIGVEICGALEAVHDAGLLHRDVKAQNVMRSDSGRIVLLDFGAGAEHRSDRRLDPGTLAGTPLYVAPEVLDGARPTPQSDIYSVGVLLFHLVTGSFPVHGRSLEEITERLRLGNRLPLAQSHRDLPRSFTATIERAMDPVPARRFNAHALRQALTDAIAELAGVATSTRRRPLWVVGALAAALCVAIFVTGWASGIWGHGSRPSSGAIAQAAAPVSIRRVGTPAMGLGRAGTPSFDGRLYSNVDPNLDLEVLDLQSGVPRRLTNKGLANEYAEFSAISPDGARVVYSWLTAGDVYDLRIIDVVHKQPRVLVPAGHALQIVPVEWARDGAAVLCLVRQPAGHFQMALVSIPAGDLRILRDLGSIEPQHMSLSADGRFVAYDFPAAASEKQRDIFIQPADGSPAHPLIAHPADDLSPVWTPDGRHLLFISNRSGSYDLWGVDVADGVVAGEPSPIARDVGDAAAISGFTSAGALYYWRRSGDSDVFTRDITSGAAGRAVRIPSNVEGVHSAPAWSPDGQYLAYLSRRDIGGPSPSFVIVIHPLNGGADRQLAIPFKNVVHTVIRWSPDGREILFSGLDRAGRSGGFALQIDSGEIAPLGIAGIGHSWIDGRSLAYISSNRIVVREPGSNVERVLFDAATQPRLLELDNFEISPDGSSLAICAYIAGTKPVVKVLLVSTIGGVPFELMRATMPGVLSLHAWTPDGRALFVTRRDGSVTPPHALWRVSIDGEARDTSVPISGYTHVNRIQFDPTGERVAYTADQVRWELWVMEHFLPESMR